MSKKTITIDDSITLKTAEAAWKAKPKPKPKPKPKKKKRT
jgi:hypothetical protein